MAKKKIDFTGVEAYVKCEEGEHVAVLKEIEEKESSNGNDMFVAKFEIVAGASTGAIVYENFPLVDKALWKLKSYMEAIGLKADGKMLVDTNKLTGKKLILVVKHEEYNGSTKARIEAFKKLSAKATKPSNQDELDDLDEDDEWDEV